MKKIFLGIIGLIVSIFAVPQQPKQPVVLTLEQALQAMKTGVVRVTFPKVNGGISTHEATRNLSLMPTEKHPTGAGKKSSGIAFYSLTANAWRSISEKPEIIANATFELI